MTELHRSTLHLLVVDDDPDESEWDGERHWHIEHPNCEYEPGSMSEPGFEYVEYKCAVEHEYQANGIDLFGGPQYWDDGHFEIPFRLVYTRDYFDEVDMEIEVDESGGE